MSEIIACGYVGVTAPDLQAWRTFATEGLGLQVGSGSSESALLLRMDERAWRVCVVPGSGGLAFSGWEVRDSQAFARLGERLERSGVEVKEDGDLAAERGVEAVLRCEDPAGNQVEFFYGARVCAEAFVSPTGARFVTGHSVPGDMGFGHIVVSYPDVDAASSFFFGALGFRKSDICLLGEPWFFAHVNPRHHSLAFGPGPGPSALHHFMLEVTDLDVVGRALDYFGNSPYAPTTTLGKHTNDHMVSFYVRTPSGFEVEYGCHGRLIDDACWTTSTYESASVWGHQNTAAGGA